MGILQEFRKAFGNAKEEIKRISQKDTSFPLDKRFATPQLKEEIRKIQAKAYEKEAKKQAAIVAAEQAKMSFKPKKKPLDDFDKIFMKY